MAGNVPALYAVANYGTDYFPLKVKFLAENKRELTTKLTPEAASRTDEVILPHEQ